MSARHNHRLVDRLDLAHARLDRATDLMQWSIEFRELLYMGVLDLDDAVAEVDAFKRAITAHRRGAP
jgi:hypothetical protein